MTHHIDPMICLAIDTAGTACAACVYDSDSKTVLAEISEEIGKGHAERLMDIIFDVMEMADVTYPDIAKVITSIGPGSFTGIRVGVATARGFGVGLGVEVVGVNTLEALLYQVLSATGPQAQKNVGIAMDAGRGQAYCLFEFPSQLADEREPFVADIASLKTALKQLDFPVQLYGSAADNLGGKPAPADFDTLLSSKVLIGTIAILGADRHEDGKKPEPLYLRKPDAVPQSNFAVERAG